MSIPSSDPKVCCVVRVLPKGKRNGQTAGVPGAEVKFVDGSRIVFRRESDARGLIKRERLTVLDRADFERVSLLAPRPSVNFDGMLDDAPSECTAEAREWQQIARTQETFRRATSPDTWDWWSRLCQTNDGRAGQVKLLLLHLTRAREAAARTGRVKTSPPIDWLTELRRIVAPQVHIEVEAVGAKLADLVRHMT